MRTISIPLNNQNIVNVFALSSPKTCLPIAMMSASERDALTFTKQCRKTKSFDIFIWQQKRIIHKSNIPKIGIVFADRSERRQFCFYEHLIFVVDATNVDKVTVWIGTERLNDTTS